LTADEAAAPVPMAWFCAQDMASSLIRTGGLPWPQASFEFRATHDVLALTSLFTRVATAESAARRDLLRAQRTLVDHDIGWALWCEDRFSDPCGDITMADMRSARGAWRWLTRSRLLGGTPHDGHHTCEVIAGCQGAGLSVGVAQARRLLDRHLLF